MNLQYLVDTDWAIHYLNGQPQIVERLQELQSRGLGLSVISLAELYEGVYYSHDPSGSEQGLHDFLGNVTLVLLDEEVCQVFGRERGRLRSQSKLIGDFDLLIGATAIRHDLTLLTNNRRHFEMLQGLRLISQ